MHNPEEPESRDMIKSIDPWLPPGIRNNTTLSLEGLIRSRVLTVIMISSMVTTAFGFFMCLFFQFITDHDFTNPIIISIVCFFLVGLDYLYFYKSAKLESSGILYSLTFFILCTVAIVLTGGYHSPVKQILIGCPVISFLISGRQEGVYNAALVFVAGITLLVLDSINFELIQIISEDAMPYVSGIIWLITITLIVVCLYVYDLLLDEKRSIRAKH